MVEAGAAIILVIDDEPVVRMLARRALESFGYITLGAKDGADGVRVLAEQTAPVAAVLLDMSMPGMTAEETLNAIHAADASTRVVIMTGFAEESAAAHDWVHRKDPLHHGLKRVERERLLQKPCDQTFGG